MSMIDTELESTKELQLKSDKHTPETAQCLLLPIALKLSQHL